ncbi:hypothetical protein [Streptomyces cavernae]|uniref:hypothetical protein n=1 Tax=Streptomyces cavernae TaxID=2259034 RepID=UPI000FEBED02|nr:hypothetical protein [Streptomyces cavernae]
MTENPHTIRRIAHHLGLPVRRDEQEARMLAHEARAAAEDNLTPEQADRFEQEAYAIVTRRVWHRPYLRS